MAGYSEIASEKTYEVGTDGPPSGVRVFIDNANGTDSLPAPLEPFPSFAAITVRRYRVSQYEGSPTVRRIEVIYGVQNAPAGTEAQRLDKARKSVRVGGELYPYRNRGNVVKWSDTLQPVSTNVPLFVRIVMLDLTVETQTRAFNAYLAKMIDRAGKVNAATFLGCPAGFALFNGGELDYCPICTDTNNPNATVDNWNVRLSFGIRVIQRADGQDPVSWAAVFREETATWVDVTPAPHLSADMRQLV